MHTPVPTSGPWRDGAGARNLGRNAWDAAEPSRWSKKAARWGEEMWDEMFVPQLDVVEVP
jgi:hypothetical protein